MTAAAALLVGILVGHVAFDLILHWLRASRPYASLPLPISLPTLRAPVEPVDWVHDDFIEAAEKETSR